MKWKRKRAVLKPCMTYALCDQEGKRTTITTNADASVAVIAQQGKESLMVPLPHA